MSMKYDFSGWVTRYGIKCSDGRTIRHGAFTGNDKKRVPLVYMHNHKDNNAVLGFLVLEDRKEGMYGYGSFNDTERAKNARSQISHGDISALSIFANKLREQNGNVYHGDIKEVSLVLAGANKEAIIDKPIIHYEDGSWEYDEAASEDEFIFMMPSEGTHLEHGGILEGYDEYGYIEDLDDTDDYISHAEDNKAATEKTDSKKKKDLEEVLNGLPEDEREVVYVALAYAVEHASELKNTEGESEAAHSDIEEEGDYDMPRFNVFERNEPENVLSHAEFLELQKEVFEDVGNFGGSLKRSFLAHAGDKYGIESIDYLYPEAQRINGNEPEILNYSQEWVNEVMSGISHSPFSRVKMEYADITGEEARAKGYFKGDRKEEEVFGLLRRELRPTMIYSKQKLDRQDLIEITDFSAAALVKKVGRLKLDEECARAMIFGDGRSPLSKDKIKEDCIVPVVKEDPLYCIKWEVSTGIADANYTVADKTAMNVIRGAIKSRKGYRGSGRPVLFTYEDLLSDMLLLQDKMGHDLYESEEKLATKMRVSKIVTVPDEIFPIDDLYGVILNLSDYRIGMNKGGQISLFDQFDINYNQEIYLSETSFSGGLVKPFSAIVLKKQK